MTTPFLYSLKEPRIKNKMVAFINQSWMPGTMLSALQKLQQCLALSIPISLLLHREPSGLREE